MQAAAYSVSSARVLFLEKVLSVVGKHLNDGADVYALKTSFLDNFRKRDTRLWQIVVS